MKDFNILRDLPISDNGKAKFILLVYSVTLGHVLVFLLKLINDLEMILIEKVLRIKKSQIVAIFLILVLFSFSLMIWFRLAFFKGKSITFNVDYSDECLLGADTPAVDFEIMIEYSTGSLYTTLYTDETGTATFYITQMDDFYYRYIWKGLSSAMIDLDESMSYSIDLELDCLEIQANLIWEHDLTPVTDPVDLLWFDGTDWVVVKAGYVSGAFLDGLFIGTFMFEQQTTAFEIDQTLTEPYVFDAYISPILLKNKEFKPYCSFNKKPYLKLIKNYRNGVKKKNV